jgi:hypothetical protein
LIFVEPIPKEIAKLSSGNILQIPEEAEYVVRDHGTKFWN